MTLFIRRNLPQEITVMIINTGQMCTVNYSGRNVRFKVPRLDKKCVVDIVYYKKKTSQNIRRIKRQLFLFHTVMYRHFLNLISQDFWCPHLFVSADITVPVLYIKDAAVKRSQSHSKVNCKYLHPIMNEALRRSLGNYYNIALLIGQ